MTWNWTTTENPCEAESGIFVKSVLTVASNKVYSGKKAEPFWVIVQFFLKKIQREKKGKKKRSKKNRTLKIKIIKTTASMFDGNYSVLILVNQYNNKKKKLAHTPWEYYLVITKDILSFSEEEKKKKRKKKSRICLSGKVTLSKCLLMYKWTSTIVT